MILDKKNSISDQSEDIIFGWKAVRSEYYGKYGKCLRLFSSLLASLGVWGSISAYTIISYGLNILSYITIIMIIPSFFFVHFIIQANYEHVYKLKKSGIYSYKRQLIPNGFYVFFRFLAWISIIIGFSAIFIIGPLAFVGSAGFSLLSIYFIKYSPYVTENICYFRENSKIYDVYESGYITYLSSPFNFNTNITLFYDDNGTKNRIIHNIKELSPTTSLEEVATSKELERDCFFINTYKEARDRFKDAE